MDSAGMKKPGILRMPGSCRSGPGRVLDGALRSVYPVWPAGLGGVLG